MCASNMVFLKELTLYLFSLIFLICLCKALGNETPNLVGGHVSSAPLTSEISSLEDSTFKVGKLSVEQRREKIHRYMKKRNERNFSKKIKVLSVSHLPSL